MIGGGVKSIALEQIIKKSISSSSSSIIESLKRLIESYITGGDSGKLFTVGDQDIVMYI